MCQGFGGAGRSGRAPRLLGPGRDVRPALTLGGGELLLLFPVGFVGGRFRPFGSFREVWGDIYILFFFSPLLLLFYFQEDDSLRRGREG